MALRRGREALAAARAAALLARRDPADGTFARRARNTAEAIVVILSPPPEEHVASAPLRAPPPARRRSFASELHFGLWFPPHVAVRCRAVDPRSREGGAATGGPQAAQQPVGASAASILLVAGAASPGAPEQPGARHPAAAARAHSAPRLTPLGPRWARARSGLLAPVAVAACPLPDVGLFEPRTPPGASLSRAAAGLSPELAAQLVASAAAAPAGAAGAADAAAVALHAAARATVGPGGGAPPSAAAAGAAARLLRSAEQLIAAADGGGGGGGGGARLECMRSLAWFLSGLLALGAAARAGPEADLSPAVAAFRALVRTLNSEPLPTPSLFLSLFVSF
jgi:hypothetical protein